MKLEEKSAEELVDMVCGISIPVFIGTDIIVTISDVKAEILRRISPGDEVLFKMKDKLTKLAGRECWSDDENFMVDDYAGGNFDDAYSGGVEDGEASLARELLKEMVARGETNAISR